MLVQPTLLELGHLLLHKVRLIVGRLHLQGKAQDDVVAVIALHDVTDLAGLQGQGRLLELGDHLTCLHGLIAVRVGGQSGVLAVIVHQLVEQGGGVAALPQLAEQILRLSLLLRRGSLVQGLSGLRVLGQQQDVLDGVQLPVVLDVGEQVGVGGLHGAVLSKILILKLAVQVLALTQLGVELRSQGILPQVHGHHVLAPHGLSHSGQLIGKGVLEVLGQGHALPLRYPGDQGVQGRSPQRVVQSPLGQGDAGGVLRIPGQLGDAEIGAVITEHAVGAVRHPVQQLSGGDVHISHLGHHSVTRDAGGGEEHIRDGVQVHGDRFTAGGAPGGTGRSAAPGAPAVLTAGGQGKGQDQGREGQGPRPFHRSHKSSSFLFHPIQICSGPQGRIQFDIIPHLSSGFNGEGKNSPL